jgi:hypothetical protein
MIYLLEQTELSGADQKAAPSPMQDQAFFVLEVRDHKFLPRECFISSPSRDLSQSN